MLFFRCGIVGSMIVDAFESKYNLEHQESIEKAKEVYEEHYADIVGVPFEEELEVCDGDLKELQKEASTYLAVNLYAHMDWDYWKKLISELEIGYAILDAAYVGYVPADTEVDAYGNGCLKFAKNG